MSNNYVIEYQRYIRQELLDKFEFVNYGHALEILSEAFSG